MIKVWGAEIEDINSGAVYCDVILEYSAEAVVLMLKRFSAVHGWPVWMMSFGLNKGVTIALSPKYPGFQRTLIGKLGFSQIMRTRSMALCP